MSSLRRPTRSGSQDWLFFAQTFEAAIKVLRRRLAGAGLAGQRLKVALELGEPDCSVSPAASMKEASVFRASRSVEIRSASSAIRSSSAATTSSQPIGDLAQSRGSPS
jgi:hypothetical protein